MPDTPEEAVVDLGTVTFSFDEWKAFVVVEVHVPRLLVKAGLCPSIGEAGRKIKEGAVEIDEEAVTDVLWWVPRHVPFLVRLGRKWLKIEFREEETKDDREEPAQQTATSAKGESPK